MAKIFGNFHLALLIGVILLLIAMFGLHGDLLGTGAAYWTQWLRFLHIFAGILWIGLLYYFNFVQTPTMPKVPAELKPGINKYIAPVALFWFRWAAVATVVIGLALAETSQPGYIGQALTFKTGHKSIGVGMWLGLIMAANVWFVIWPNQKKVLGIVPAADDVKARSATMGMIASRINMILSIPMLYCMVTQAHFGAP